MQACLTLTAVSGGFRMLLKDDDCYLAEVPKVIAPEILSLLLINTNLRIQI